MKSYSETVFSAREKELFHLAESLVQKLPDEPLLRCHEVARAVGRVLGLQVQDGWYGLVDHSWLWTAKYPWKPTGLAKTTREILKETPPPARIIDTYAIGRLPQVQLLDVMFVLPHVGTTRNKRGYIPGKPRTDVDEALVERLYQILVGE